MIYLSLLFLTRFILIQIQRVLFAVTFSMNGCSKDDPSDDDGDDDGEGTTVETNTTAMTEEKEMVVKMDDLCIYKHRCIIFRYSSW